MGRKCPTSLVQPPLNAQHLAEKGALCPKAGLEQGKATGGACLACTREG